MFYLLSLLTGILECGWISFGAVHSLPLWQILCYPLAYHIGNLFPKPFSLSRSILRIMCFLSAMAGILTFTVQLSENAVFVLTCIALFLLSSVIQSVRSGLKSDGNRLLKRVFRVGGFALAPLVVMVPSAILVLSSIVVFLALNVYKGKTGITRMTGQNGFSIVMILHQLHYFFYAHITLTAMSLLLSRVSTTGIVYAALLFCGTWVTYMSVEPIFSQLTSRILPVFYAGHIGIVVSPYRIVWDNSRCYMVCSVKADKGLRFLSYRIDRMFEVSIEKEKREFPNKTSPFYSERSSDRFNARKFLLSSFNMFTSDESEAVEAEFKVHRRMVRIMVERFGFDVDRSAVQDEEEYYFYRTFIQPSKGFFSWLSSYEPADIKLVSPPKLVREYKEHLKKIISGYDE